MDSQNTQPDNQVNEETHVQPPVTAENTQPPTLPERPQKQMNIKPVLIACVAVLLLALIPLAYMLGKSQASTDEPANKSVSEISSTSDTKTAEEVDEPETDIVDAYSGWKSFENEAYGYSFKYPADWQVDREVIQEPADWVSINPSGQASAGSVGDVLAIFTYADGVGCPKTKTKEFTIGGYTVEGTACAGTEVYKVTMKHSKVASSGKSRVILARTASNMVGIQIDLDRGENETIQRILDSVTGLTPYNG